MIITKLLKNLHSTKNIYKITFTKINMNHSMAKQIIDNNKFTGVRLPSDIKPLHYDLWIKPNFDNFSFKGEVAITYESTASDKSSVVLNAQDLTITNGFQQASGQEKPNILNNVIYSKTTETATLQFENPLTSKGMIKLLFDGELNDKLKGFYRSEFKIGSSNVRAATTQFEATDARRCFPCWDEPAVKATFNVTLVIDEYMTVDGQQYERVALSNMPEVHRSRDASGTVEIKFDKTPIMSTYLLAFVIGPFEMIEAENRGRPVRVFTTPGKKEQGRYALDVACKALTYYEDYFDVAYPLPKMDLIAIPDFCSGAMENWGLVTYRETCLLVDPTNTATIVKQNVAIVVAHELAHQWFGNLVTMEWWTHLWLNEGFASFMEYLCVDHIFPEYDIWSQFITDSYSRALSLDALHNSHPIEVPVKHPSEIDEIFDDISYNKGASVIRMLYNYIGDDHFRRGMKQYLTKFAYKNAFTEDLWDSLEAESSKPVRKLMSSWTSQKGFPWISVDYKQESGKAYIKLTQNKFSADGSLSGDEVNASWMVPISFASADTPKFNEVFLLEDKSLEVTLDVVGDSWVKLNPGTIGLYRSAYPEKLLERFLPAILNKTLPPMDRLGLQNDFFALCQAGKVGTVDLLKLLGAFKGETVFNVWASIDSCMASLSVLLDSSELKDKFRAFGCQLYSDILKKVTWTPRPGEDDADAMTRALVINRLVSFGDSKVVDEALRMFPSHVNKKCVIPADLRGAVYKAVSKKGDDNMYDCLMTIYRMTEMHEEKNRVARSLAAASDETRLQRTIDFGFSDEVRIQDKVFLFANIGLNNPQAGWKLFVDHKDFFKEKYCGSTLMPRIVKYLTEGFVSMDRAREIEQFFLENKFPGTERTVQQSIETIALNANWLARDFDAIRAFFNNTD